MYTQHTATAIGADLDAIRRRAAAKRALASAASKSIPPYAVAAWRAREQKTVAR